LTPADIRGLDNTSRPTRTTPGQCEFSSKLQIKQEKLEESSSSSEAPDLSALTPFKKEDDLKKAPVVYEVPSEAKRAQFITRAKGGRKEKEKENEEDRPTFPSSGFTSEIDNRKAAPPGKKGEYNPKAKYPECFSKEEITELHIVVQKEPIRPSKNDPHLDPLCAGYTKFNKAIIPQAFPYSCTAAASAMLILDKHGQCDTHALKERNFGGSDDLMTDIRNADFTPIKNTATNVEDLAKLINKNGSAIVSIMMTETSILMKRTDHSIVVDAITDKEVRLRDPYHGWEISVTLTAFARHFLEGDVIQIAS
jgi:hypothetical protein